MSRRASRNPLAPTGPLVDDSAERDRNRVRRREVRSQGFEPAGTEDVPGEDLAPSDPL